ncbi:MAG: HprK-related kinase A [Hydrogenophaga sp.]|uniref:HprK-related kinase A n=1 Tax=Hydrogenophaga sp. TaxID=1904254 RepID=UPI001DD404C7|nr:HprK-related kinase A [Hydrogenophaga sp.]MBX3611515.1 HprK-related kinase A [Hydrogenophaga sp.]
MSDAPSLSSLTESELSSRLNGAGLVVSIPPFKIQIKSPIPVVAEGLRALYGAYGLVNEPDSFRDFHLGLVPRMGWRRPLCELDVDGMRPFTPLARGEAFALFEWGLNWCITSHCHNWLTIHAAVVERNGLAVIMPAPPGSGKSTLCAWLMHQGWRLLSDELALVDPQSGLLTACPRPISLKNNSIQLMKGLLPKAVFGPIAHDTSKGTVAHMGVSDTSLQRASESALPRWIVFPQYTPGAPLSVHQIEHPQALVELASNSFNYHVHGRSGFERLAAMIDNCDVVQLTYSRLDEATAWFDGLSG